MKFKPKCLRNEIQLAMTNRGHLIPCCYCDCRWSLKTPVWQKMLKVSKVSEVEDIEEILFSKEWLEFEKNLRTEKNIPQICIETCTETDDDYYKIKKETFLDPEGNKIGKEIV
jgi:hypothetical protein